MMHEIFQFISNLNAFFLFNLFQMMNSNSADGEATEIRFKRIITPDYTAHLSFENKSCKFRYSFFSSAG